MQRGRTIAWALTTGAAALFAVSIVPMARRIADFNSRASLLSLHIEPIVSRTIDVEGFPKGRLTDETPPQGAPPGIGSIRLEYGGRDTHISVKSPPALNLPNLSGYDEWLKVLAIYEVTRDAAGDQRGKPGSQRLLIVVRRTPEGFDPQTWGEVRRDEWLFDFYDLRPNGDVTQTTRRWPRKSSYGDPEARLRREAAGEGVDPARAASARQLLLFEPLKERTLEYAAAMFVIPKLSMPEYKFNDTAFSFDVLGWTLPAAMGSVLVFCGAIVFALAPRRRAPSKENAPAV